MRDRMAACELLVVTGKGGVGKTAVAAALGGLFAADGKRVLLLEIDPRESAHQMLACPPSGGEAVAVGRRLFLQNLRPRAVLDQLVGEKLKFGFLARRVLASPVYRHFAEGGPGLKELAVLGHALRCVRGSARGVPKVDLVVLDAPATGHGVALLAAPLLVAEVIQGGPIGRLTGEVAALVRDRRRTAVAAVTLAEEMPVTEALELRRMLGERLGREPDLLAVNRLYPRLPAGLAKRPRGEDAALDLWRERRAVNDAELERVAAGWPGPRAELPFLALARGPELVAELGRRLGDLLAAAGAAR